MLAWEHKIRCPHCTKSASAYLDAAAQRIEDQYGKIPVGEYIERIVSLHERREDARRYVDASVDVNVTYEIDDHGTLSLQFKARCSVCDSIAYHVVAGMQDAFKRREAT